MGNGGSPMAFLVRSCCFPNNQIHERMGKVDGPQEMLGDKGG